MNVFSISVFVLYFSKDLKWRCKISEHIVFSLITKGKTKPGNISVVRFQAKVFSCLKQVVPSVRSQRCEPGAMKSSSETGQQAVQYDAAPRHRSTCLACKLNMACQVQGSSANRSTCCLYNFFMQFLEQRISFCSILVQCLAKWALCPRRELWNAIILSSNNSLWYYVTAENIECETSVSSGAWQLD